MNRFFLASALAVILHLLFLDMGGKWLTSKIIPRSRNEPIAMTLSYIKPQKKLSPSQKKPVNFEERSITQKKVLKKSPPKQSPKKKPKKKVEIIKTGPSNRIESPARKPMTQFAEPEEKLVSRVVSAPLQTDEGKSFPENVPPPQFDKKLGVASALGKEKGGKIKVAIPYYQKNPSPRYPRSARRRGHQGTVFMEVLVDKGGRVEDLRLLQSSGYPILDRAAMASVKKWLFEPGMRGGEKVAMWVRVPIRFKLK